MLTSASFLADMVNMSAHSNISRTIAAIGTPA
jgi:hypothetical protein